VRSAISSRVQSQRRGSRPRRGRRWPPGDLVLADWRRVPRQAPSGATRGRIRCRHPLLAVALHVGVLDAQHEDTRFPRAKSQLNSAVRALPTWKNPVGEGAKRTRVRSSRSTLITRRRSRCAVGQLFTASRRRSRSSSGGSRSGCRGSRRREPRTPRDDAMQTALLAHSSKSTRPSRTTSRSTARPGPGSAYGPPPPLRAHEATNAAPLTSARARPGCGAPRTCAPPLASSFGARPRWSGPPGGP